MRQNALLWAALLSLCTGCAARTDAADDDALFAIEAAIVTLTDARPAPPPEPDDQAGATYGGPLDMLRDARALIDKGNALADRGKTLLDAAERDGKITIDVRLPTNTHAGMNCDSGRCTPPPADQPERRGQPQPAGTTDTCTAGRCYPTTTVTRERQRLFIGRRR